MWAAKGYAVFVPEMHSSASFGSLAITRDDLQKHNLIDYDIKDITPMLTVAHQSESALMAKNDSRSSWTLIDLNFESSQVVFKNRQSQFIKLTV